MSEAPRTFREVIDLWPSRKHLARDVADQRGGSPNVRDWHLRNAIPLRHHADVVASARRHKIPGITMTFLARLFSEAAAARRAEREATTGPGGPPQAPAASENQHG